MSMLRCIRRLSSTSKVLQKDTKFFEEEAVSSVSERNLFQEIFTKMMPKETNSKNSFEPIAGASKENFQVLFDRVSNKLEADKLKLSGDVAAKLTTDDIRNYPVSITPSYISSNARKIIQMKNREQLVHKLTVALTPCTEYIDKLETDWEVLQMVQKYISSFSMNESGEVDFVKLNERAKLDPSSLPEPFNLTLPFLMLHALKTLRSFGNDTSVLTTFVGFKENLQLYLTVCNVDMYNLILDTNWKAYQDISQIKNLVMDMKINGISGDLQTVKVLEQITDDMRHLNDDILDEIEFEKAKPTGVMWCTENARNLTKVEGMLLELKKELTA